MSFNRKKGNALGGKKEINFADKLCFGWASSI